MIDDFRGVCTEWGVAIVTSAFRDLLKIYADILRSLFWTIWYQKKPVPAKEKSVSKRTNTTGLIQNRLGVVEKEKGEVNLDVRDTRKCSCVSSI